MTLSSCPLLTLKSPEGPRGCGKREARSLLNSCVTEFPHNTTKAYLRPERNGLNTGQKPRPNSVLKQQLIRINLRREGKKNGAGNLVRDEKNIQQW